MANYRIISSDNHVMEPPDLWTDRIEPKFRDRAPKMTRAESGTDWWYCDGKQMVSVMPGTQTGVRFEEPEKLSLHEGGTFYEDVRPGGYIPEEHVKDLDIDGIDVSILYPTLGLLLFSHVGDSELLSAIFRSYNDWLAKFCSAFPKRLKGIAMVNVDEVQDGVKELERCTKMGLPGAMISVYPPENKPYHLPDYEPLWAAAQDLQMPLSLHIGTNRPGPGQQFDDLITMTPTFFINSDHWLRMSVGHMVYYGVFERFPKLQIGSVEVDLAWVPYFLDRLDYSYTQRFNEAHPYRYKEDMLPSDYFHRNVFLSFQEDAMGIRDRHVIGVDSLVWGGDYPHAESTFPRSRQILEEILVDCTEEEKAKIVGENAARIYRFD